MRTFHKQLLSVKSHDFDQDDTTPVAEVQRRKKRRTGGHQISQYDDWMTLSGGVQKRRQRSCKVCALLRGDRNKSYTTTYYCLRCSVDGAKCFLCPKARREYGGVLKTCFDIWHEDFKMGENIPSTLGKRFVLRAPPTKTGQRKKTQRELRLERESKTEEEEQKGE